MTDKDWPVLVDPIFSPKWIGISWSDVHLVAFRGCHLGSYLHSDGKGDWYCSECRVEVTDVGTGASICHTSIDEESIREWVAAWTDIPLRDLNVEKN